jgi:VRR-NUC domain-containing protein
MQYLNKRSNNEKAIQEFYIARGYQSVRRGWPDFCFWKKNKNGAPEFIFVEVKRHDEGNIKPWQRKIKNIFRSLNLDYRVAFGLNEDGTSRFRKDIPGINDHIHSSEENVVT